MTRLILIRHAKSGWDDPFADDHARVLTKRGRGAAGAVGRWLAQTGYVPQLILCSDAARTMETCDHLTAGMGQLPPVRPHSMLYHASPDTILEQISREEAQTIAVIAHNPGIGMLADALVRQRPAHHRFLDYPTCATSVIDFEGPIAIGHGTLVDFVVPKDLKPLADSDV